MSTRLRNSLARQPNWSTISHYLTTFRTTMGRETMFRGIRQLRPAEYLDWNVHTGQVQIARYWDFPKQKQSDITFSEAADELESLLTDATTSRLVSDVPVGMFLSGGVDSSVIVVSSAASEVNTRHASEDAHPPTRDEKMPHTWLPLRPLKKWLC